MLVLVIAAAGVAIRPEAAPAQVSLEDVVFQSLEITADIRPVQYREVCDPGGSGVARICRPTTFGTVKGRTVAQFQVTSPTPVSTVRLYIDPDYALRITSSQPLATRRDGPYWLLVFNPALAPGTTGTLTFDYEGQSYPVYDDFIWVGEGDLYPIVISSFSDFFSPNRSRMKITATVPSGVVLASSGRMSRQESGGVQTYVWEGDEPVALVSVIGGKGYNVAQRTAGTLALTMLLHPRADRFADQIADYTLKAADHYSRLLYPFPFSQLSAISAPFGRGLLGVAFPGMMMITEDAFTGGQTGDLARDSFRLLVVAHETAHTYFPYQTSGKGVASVWLSEGFAEYLGMMTVEAVMGAQAFRKELDEDRGWYASVAGRDRAVGSYTRVNSNGPDAIAVRYAKGAFILHMLRFVVGDDAFRRLLSTYATRFRNQSVRVEDFADVASEVAGRDLTWFFREWITDLVLPDYTVAEASSAQAEGGFRTTGRVRNLGSGTMPVDVAFEAEGGERVVQRVELGSRADVTLTATTSRRVTRVEVDPGKWMLQSNYTNDSTAVR